MSALSVLCAQLTRDLFAIAKFLLVFLMVPVCDFDGLLTVWSEESWSEDSLCTYIRWSEESLCTYIRCSLGRRAGKNLGFWNF